METDRESMDNNDLIDNEDENASLIIQEIIRRSQTDNKDDFLYNTQDKENNKIKEIYNKDQTSNDQIKEENDQAEKEVQDEVNSCCEENNYVEEIENNDYNNEHAEISVNDNEQEPDHSHEIESRLEIDEVIGNTPNHDDSKEVNKNRNEDADIESHHYQPNIEKSKDKQIAFNENNQILSRDIPSHIKRKGVLFAQHNVTISYDEQANVKYFQIIKADGTLIQPKVRNLTEYTRSLRTKKRPKSILVIKNRQIKKEQKKNENELALEKLNALINECEKDKHSENSKELNQNKKIRSLSTAERKIISNYN